MREEDPGGLQAEEWLGLTWSDFKIWVLVGNRLCRGRGMEGTTQKQIGLSEASQDGCSQGGEKWSIREAFGLCPAIFRDGQDCGSSSSVGEMGSLSGLRAAPRHWAAAAEPAVDVQVKGFCSIWEKEISTVGTRPHPLGAPPDRKPRLLPYPASSYSSSSSRPDVASPMKPPASRAACSTSPLILLLRPKCSSHTLATSRAGTTVAVLLLCAHTQSVLCK